MNVARSETSTEQHAWDTPATALPGVGPKRAKKIAALGIETVGDILLHFPREYIDRRHMTKLGELVEGETVTVLAEIVDAKAMRFRRNANICVVTVKDETGTATAKWFGRGYLKKQMEPGKHVLLTGSVGNYKGMCINNPDYRLYAAPEDADADIGRLEPIYPLTEGITQRMLRPLVTAALDMVEVPADPLPRELALAFGFASPLDALRAAHQPESEEESERAQERFTYARLLALQTAIVEQRRSAEASTTGIRHVVDGGKLEALRDDLPFALTGAQSRCVKTILEDMAAARSMARLLQGDVGSGKTCVALHAIAAALDGGHQVALMAPTEVLAEQHFRTITESLAPLGIHTAILTGSTASAAGLRRDIGNGDVPVVIGTHALFQNATVFRNLGLVIVDEQHRFGVEQRERLVRKGAEGAEPDVLHMTATPLPRSLALTLYGRMDLAILDELPPGRLPVQTNCIPDAKENDLWKFLVEQAGNGFQSYVICPFVDQEDNENSVVKRFESLAKSALSGATTALLHGRMDSETKRDTLNQFREGNVDILFSTTVVEVGVDVPNATTMVILDAYRFGLTQLHQLRGRVGRGAEKSYCFLLGESPTDEGQRRLNIFCETHDGFKLADADLELRGPGEVQGLRQSGFDDARMLAMLRDSPRIEQARNDAETILSGDPELSDPDHAGLAQATARFRGMIL